MTKTLLSVLVLISSLAIAPVVFPQAATQSAKLSVPVKASTVAVNPAALQLKPEVSSQLLRIQNLLPAQTKQKIARLVLEFDRQVRARSQATDFRELATGEVQKQFPHLTPQQTNILTFALLNDSYNHASASLGDLSTMDQLQTAMDQKSQLESVFSNMLKSIADTSDSVIQNIK